MIKTNIKNPDRVRKRQKQICRGAMKVFTKKGFHAASMREIAKSTRISLGNLYDYIEKKEDILFLVHKDILEQIYQQFEETVINYQNPVEQLTNILREITKLAFRLKEEVLFVYTETRSLEKKYLYMILREESKFVSKIESLIKRGMKKGVFQCQNPAILANIIAFNLAILPLRGWNILRKDDEGRFVKELIRLILKSLGVKSKRFLPVKTVLQKEATSGF
jgi:AcrR family transcriptional regulator